MKNRAPHTGKLNGSTLTEMLVVMILTGIVLLSLFDGVSLFEKLLHRIQGRLEKTTVQAENLYRLQSLFAGSDSIRGEAVRMELYRQGEVRDEILIEEPLLIISRRLPDIPPDTLPGKVSDPRIVRNTDCPESIDSLYLRLDTTLLRLGITPRPERITEIEIRKIEENDTNHEDQ